MIANRPAHLVFVVLPLVLASCNAGVTESTLVGVDTETSLLFTNFSVDMYAALAVREASPQGAEGDYVTTPLLPPGGTYRERFLDVLGVGCPGALDLRVFLYRRVNDDLPIGLDDGEKVDVSPEVAGEVLAVPACDVQELESYTVVNWEAEPGVGRVKIAQETAVEDAIRAADLFGNTDAVWEISGVEPALADVAPPSAASNIPVGGQVILTDGTGVGGIGVLIRARFRVRLDDDPANDPDADYGDPIAFTETDESGAYNFDRPPGVYRIEFFSDDFAFRPAQIDVFEEPGASIDTIAEPLQ